MSTEGRGGGQALEGVGKEGGRGEAEVLFFKMVTKIILKETIKVPKKHYLMKLS
jgi:hypothetical protein